MHRNMPQWTQQWQGQWPMAGQLIFLMGALGSSPPPPKKMFSPTEFFRKINDCYKQPYRLATLLQNQHFSSSGPSIPIRIKA